MTIVLQQDARRAIIADFGTWAATHLEKRTPATDDSQAYYAYLQSHRPQLLEFRHPCPDKSQVVRSWLSDAGLLSP